jgi:P4 family phage/plasmid primase-like protien
MKLCPAKELGNLPHCSTQILTSLANKSLYRHQQFETMSVMGRQVDFTNNPSAPTQRNFMIDFTQPTTKREQQLREAKTANQVAATLYPKIANNFTAFLECEAGHINEFPYLELMDLNDDFWALTLGYMGNETNPMVFVPEENQFRRYDSDTGIYGPVTESVVLGELMSNMDVCAEFFPKRLRVQTFVALRNRQRLKAAVDRAKDMLNVAAFFASRPNEMPVRNGVLDLHTDMLLRFHPARAFKETLSVEYDSEAKCDLFLNSFLRHVVAADDVDLLQRYLSQLLTGQNHSQTILVLTGEAGWGKSTLMKIIGGILGWKHAGIIRDQIFKSEHELSHYQGKRFLYHPDMPTEFLNRREASLFKQLVGGDPIWTEVKGSDEMLTLEGNFPLILACNGKPKINLDADADAWLRRLVVVPFGQAAHEQHTGKMAELIVRTEASGILNWLLEGRRKLLQSKLQLTTTKAQRERAANVLLASESPKAFVRSCIQKQKDSVILMADIYEEYQKWCRNTGVRAFTSREFINVAKEEIETTFGLKPRHDLQADGGKAKRGWTGVTLRARKAIS